MLVHQPSTSRTTPPLSLREAAVLDMTARGLTNAQVAENLRLSVHTVKFHLASIYRKLGVSNRTEAAAVYLRAGDAVAERVETTKGS